MGRSLLVANVGDSRAVMAERSGGGDKMMARDLSLDQTPYRCVVHLGIYRRTRGAPLFTSQRSIVTRCAASPHLNPPP